MFFFFVLFFFFNLKIFFFSQGKVDQFNEYIIYDNRRCLIEYRIVFEGIEDEDDEEMEDVVVREEEQEKENERWIRDMHKLGTYKHLFLIFLDIAFMEKSFQNCQLLFYLEYLIIAMSAGLRVC